MPSSANKTKQSGGFALLLVLWTLVLLALIVTHVIAAGRSEARIAANLRANATAEARADGVVYEAIFRLVDASAAGWAADGSPHKLSYPEATAVVRVVPLAGRVNPNFASVALLTALLESTGAEAGQAETVASAIADWRGRDSREFPLAQRQAPYATAGLAYAPPGAPFESIDELAHVLGMTPALLRAMAPHLSLYQQGAPDPLAADPVVAQALHHLPAPAPPPADAQSAGPAVKIETVSVEAAVATADGARFTRRAVVRLGLVFPRGYVVLAWGGEQDDD